MVMETFNLNIYLLKVLTEFIRCSFRVVTVRISKATFPESVLWAVFLFSVVVWL